MATLQRRSRLGEQESPRSSFNPSAIPCAPQFEYLPAEPTSRTSVRAEADVDLIELGEERLFSGSRRPPVSRGESRVTLGTSDQLAHLSTNDADGQAHKDELLGSLGEARQAFVLALDSLLQPFISRNSQPKSLSISEAEAAGPSAVPFTNPFVDPTAILAPFRRHSLALAPPSAAASRRASTVLASTSSSLQSSDLLLSTLVQSLQRRTSSLSAFHMRSLETSSPLVNRGSASSSSPNRPLLDELHAQIELCAPDLSPTDAELARSLGSLLICIDRLASISVAINGLSNLDEAAEHQAVGAAREVEQAERDLLWGRVDDLSERVRQLSQQRVEAARMEEDEEDEEDDIVAEPRSARASLDTFHWSPRSRDVAWDAASLSSLPSYNQEHDMASPNLPPGYFHATQLSDEKDGHDWDHRVESSPRSPEQQGSGASTSAAPEQPARRIRKVPSMQSEKMQRDLDSVSQAIERLYVVSPQLANQRVEPDRRVLRERQLAKLGNAIERLSQGRLDDQRAASLPSTIHEPETHAERSRRERDAVDKLIERIDKAASRTLADQRVELNGKRRAIIADTESAKPLTALSDPREAKRREFILEHTGKGRLAGQDAVLHSSGSIEPFPGPPPELSESITVSEFFSEDGPWSREPHDHALSKKSSAKNLFQTQKGAAEEPTVSRRGSLRIGMLKSFGSRRNSAVDMTVETGNSTMSRSPASQPTEVLAVPQFDWITEESRNLGSLVVTFWPRDDAGSSPRDEFEVLAVETESILVAPARGGPASRLSLPSRVIPQQASVTSTGVYHEVKLVTSPPSPTKSRADLEVHVPLSTAELRQSMPVSFACSICHAELVDSSDIMRYNALPSEHWAELLDAWMCHPDQALSQDLVSKGKGIKPRVDEGLVGTSYILFPRRVTKNWNTPAKAAPTRSPSDDHLFPARCDCCSALVGYHVEPLSPFEPDSTSFRLLKYAAYPLLRTSSPLAASFPEYSLPCHVTAELLETGQAHACHRFILDDTEEEKPRLLLWFFNPAIRVAFSTSSSLVRSLETSRRRTSAGSTSSNRGSHPASSTSEIDPVGRSMNAVKVFYSHVSTTEEAHYRSFVENKTEIVSYPLSVVQQLAKLLEASSLVYPPAKRRFGSFQTGFLERI